MGSRGRTRAHRALDVLLGVAFFATILAPLSYQLAFGGDGEGARMEYRKPAKMPKLALTPTFAREFEDYYDDNFGLRTPLVRWHNRLKLLWLGASPSASFVVGRDGWLFYTGERIIENHTGALRLTQDELAQWRRTLEARRDWLAARGAEYLFLVVPDKHAIYPEELPAAFRRPGVETTYEQFMDSFRAHSDFRPLDVRASLLEEKRHGLVYYRCGTHWNDVGAYVAYTHIAERLHERYPELVTVPRPEFVDDPDGTDDNFGSRMLIRDLLPQEIRSMRPERPLCGKLVAKKDPPQRVRVWECKDGKDRPTAVMFHDSQGNWLEPYLADTFSRIVCVLDGAYDTALIERESPDYVIQEIGERRLWRVPKR